MNHSRAAPPLVKVCGLALSAPQPSLGSQGVRLGLSAPNVPLSAAQRPLTDLFTPQTEPHFSNLHLIPALFLAAQLCTSSPRPPRAPGPAPLAGSD